MNIYDFDGTIYDGDSTIDFFIFSLKKKPAIIVCIPEQMLAFFRYKLGKIGKTEFKELFLCFVKRIDVQKYVDEFWERYDKNIMSWYLKQQKTDDVIISASPEFLLKPICDRLGIRLLIATKYNINTGRIIGKNCRGTEKVKRLNREFPDVVVDSFYSDSDSDLPLAKLSNNAYKVKHGVVKQWL